MVRSPAIPGRLKEVISELKTIVLLLLAACLPLVAQSQGVTPEWDVRKTIQEIPADAGRLRPILEQIKPQEWVAKGAPQAYVGQLASTRTQVDGLVSSAGLLMKEPEKLTAALDTFLRLQTIELMLHSLAEGVRRYQNPALADLLLGMVSENGATRQHLQQYLVDLAVEKEQECAIMDKEAQRCRGTLSRQPARPVTKQAPPAGAERK